MFGALNKPEDSHLSLLAQMAAQRPVIPFETLFSVHELLKGVLPSKEMNRIWGGVFESIGQGRTTAKDHLAIQTRKEKANRYRASQFEAIFHQLARVLGKALENFKPTLLQDAPQEAKEWVTRFNQCKIDYTALVDETIGDIAKTLIKMDRNNILIDGMIVSAWYDDKVTKHEMAMNAYKKDIREMEYAHSKLGINYLSARYLLPKQTNFWRVNYRHDTVYGTFSIGSK